MFKLALLATLVVCTLGASLERFPDGKIVGGEDARIEDLPWQISLIIRGNHNCGGSIINANFILTAAHCVDSRPVADFQIRAGSTFRTTGGVVIPVSHIVIHPSWNSRTTDYDYAILRLSSPLTFGPGIQPIRLAAANAVIPTGADAIVSGWGLLRENGPSPDVLQKVVVPIVSQADCSAAYPNMITDRMICAGFPEGGRDACQNDSGGPLVVDNVLVGVVSWGAGCARPNLPGIYARVSTVRAWIDAVAQ